MSNEKKLEGLFETQQKSHSHHSLRVLLKALQYQAS